MLAVFRRLDLSRLERLLGAAMGESSLQLVAFDNQPTSDASSTIPDGRISGSFSLWIETKTAANAMRIDQLRGHLQHLDSDDRMFERLLVITPDIEEPSQIAQLADPRVIWFSFRDLSDAISDLMSDQREVISEREALLLREFQTMLEEDGLLALPADTAVVAARTAYDEYLRYSAYVCQPNRHFRPGVQRLGFYRWKHIERHLPRILRAWDDVEFTEAGADRLRAGDEMGQRAADLIETLLRETTRSNQLSYKIMLLTGPDDPQTLSRGQGLPHVGSGAWTQGQRYASSDRILAAATTADLDD
jgi:hypothetical protein